MRSPGNQLLEMNSSSSAVKYFISKRDDKLLKTADYIHSGQRSPARGLEYPGESSEVMRNLSDPHSTSLISVSKHLMPQHTDATIEDFKNELKQCLRENIVHKREIKHLRLKRNDADEKVAKLQKQIEELQKLNSDDT